METYFGNHASHIETHEAHIATLQAQIAAHQAHIMKHTAQQAAALQLELERCKADEYSAQRFAAAAREKLKRLYTVSNSARSDFLLPPVRPPNRHLARASEGSPRVVGFGEGLQLSYASLDPVSFQTSSDSQASSNRAGASSFRSNDVIIDRIREAKYSGGGVSVERAYVSMPGEKLTSSVHLPPVQLTNGSTRMELDGSQQQPGLIWHLPQKSFEVGSGGSSSNLAQTCGGILAHQAGVHVPHQGLSSDVGSSFNLSSRCMTPAAPANSGRMPRPPLAKSRFCPTQQSSNLLSTSHSFNSSNSSVSPSSPNSYNSDSSFTSPSSYGSYGSPNSSNSCSSSNSSSMLRSPSMSSVSKENILASSRMGGSNTGRNNSQTPLLVESISARSAPSRNLRDVSAGRGAIVASPSVGVRGQLSNGRNSALSKIYQAPSIKSRLLTSPRSTGKTGSKLFSRSQATQ